MYRAGAILVGVSRAPPGTNELFTPVTLAALVPSAAGTPGASAAGVADAGAL